MLRPDSQLIKYLYNYDEKHRVIAREILERPLLCMNEAQCDYIRMNKYGLRQELENNVALIDRLPWERFSICYDGIMRPVDEFTGEYFTALTSMLIDDEPDTVSIRFFTLVGNKWVMQWDCRIHKDLPPWEILQPQTDADRKHIQSHITPNILSNVNQDGENLSVLYWDVAVHCLAYCLYSPESSYVSRKTATPKCKPKSAAKKPWLIDDRAHYIMLDPFKAKSSHGLPSLDDTQARPVAKHQRRGHWRTIRESKRTWVRPCWVGSREWSYRGSHYKVADPPGLRSQPDR